MSNLLALLSVLTRCRIADLEDNYQGKGYGDLKKRPGRRIRDVRGAGAGEGRRDLADPAELDRVLAAGAVKAAEVAGATAALVYDRIGFLAPARCG